MVNMNVANFERQLASITLLDGQQARVTTVLNYVQIQYTVGSEYQLFECLTFWIIWFGIQIVLVRYVLCTRPTIQISDHCIRKQDRVHLSDIEMASKNQTIWHLTFFWPTKYWGIKVKTLGLSSRWLSKLRYLSRVVLKLLKLDPHCSGNLKSGLVWISNGQKELVCKWSGFWKRSEIGKPEPLKSGHMTSIWLPFEILTKTSGFWMICFWMVGTIAIALEKPNHLKFDLQKKFCQAFRPPFNNQTWLNNLNTRLVRYSDGYWKRKICGRRIFDN